MTALAAAYIEEIANGHVPGLNSPERIAYEAEVKRDGYDYTWAIQMYQAIRAEVQREMQ